MANQIFWHRKFGFSNRSERFDSFLQASKYSMIQSKVISGTSKILGSQNSVDITNLSCNPKTNVWKMIPPFSPLHFGVICRFQPSVSEDYIGHVAVTQDD